MSKKEKEKRKERLSKIWNFELLAFMETMIPPTIDQLDLSS
jgi:hypothetical protein